MISLSATFYRIAFAKFADQVLKGAIHPEGRFHHDGQPAFYASPNPEAAAVAIDTYLKDNDAPRVLIPLQVQSEKIVDLRNPSTISDLGIDPRSPSAPWADERVRGDAATSWQASDAVRASGADGMIYASRKVPSRWHLVLFRWNQPGAAQINLAGDPAPWTSVK